MAGTKPPFAPIPLRASRDNSLTALDLRVLMCICYHDRFSISRGSAGCFATNQRLAEQAACTVTSLSRSIGRLVERAYVDRERGSSSGRRHTTIYRVRYSEETLVKKDNYHLSEGANGGTKSFARPANSSVQSIVSSEIESAN
jgi:DNA-binding MarR family transcriptional regulator